MENNLYSHILRTPNQFNNNKNRNRHLACMYVYMYVYTRWLLQWQAKIQFVWAMLKMRWVTLRRSRTAIQWKSVLAWDASAQYWSEIKRSHECERDASSPRRVVLVHCVTRSLCVCVWLKGLRLCQTLNSLLCIINALARLNEREWTLWERTRAQALKATQLWAELYSHLIYTYVHTYTHVHYIYNSIMWFS